jgi:hypothetical protein
MVAPMAAKGMLSHARQKIILGVVMATLATILQYALHVRSLGDTEKIALSLLGSATVVMLGSFFYNLIQIPATLYIDPKKKIARTPSEQHHYEQAKAALKELGESAVMMLRYLKVHRRLTFRASGPPPLPDGMDLKIALSLLEQCVGKMLVTRDQKMVDTGATYPSFETIYEIAPGMTTVLDELLYPSAPVS